MTLVEKESGIFESFDKTPLYYEVRGQGEPLVLVNGLACPINHWHFQTEHFAKSYKVITFDLRGHYKSQPLGNPKNLKVLDLARDLQGLLGHLNIAKAHFAGHSFGTPILLELFRINPEIMASMIFVNGFSRNPVKGMFGVDIIEPFFYFVKGQFEKYPDLSTSLWRLAVDNPISMVLLGAAGGFNLKLTHFKDIEVYARGVARMDLQTFLVLLEEMMKFNGEGILPLIDIPTLIISGENDNVTPQSFQHDFSQKVNGSEFVLVPYGSHCTQLDFPDYVNVKIEEFLRKASFTGK